MISFNESICTDHNASTGREWLEMNGIGGFASGTISGSHTRRYHGLLTAATKPPLGRITMLSKFLETVHIGGRTFELSTNRFPGKTEPKGYEFLSRFRLDPFPVWTYLIEGVELEKKAFMPHGENTIVVTYALAGKSRSSDAEISLALKPLLSFVDYHHLQREDPVFDTSFEVGNHVVSVSPYSSMPALFFHHSDAAVERSGYWYRNFEYAIEKERGFDFREDLFQPFVMTFDLSRKAEIVVTTEPAPELNASKLERSELKRRQALIKQAKATDELSKILTLAADQFLVRRGSGHSIIAGYPWFSDWGRDTMIALNGLTLATDRHDIARGIILEYAKYISDGMIPNRFPDEGESAEYNTVDASLWYFEAIRAYSEASGDAKTVRDVLYEKLSLMVAAMLRGTRFNIHVDTDGLLYAGETGVQLTWMDAKVGDKVITPRIGKPVEIQALWYNALKIMDGFAVQFGHEKDAAKFSAMASLAKLSFNGAFWNQEADCLYDVIDNGGRDASIRPNQIFAVSLPHSMLDTERMKKVVSKIEDELLTPFGLRSLSPNDPNYVGVYSGSPLERDSAYHQGTVWAWLIGPFIDAYRKVHPDQEAKVRQMLEPFNRHIAEAGVGQVSEIFDGNAPHIPRGCPAQAWSVAEVLRVIQCQ